MTDLLIKIFIRNKDDVDSQDVRSAYVTTASVTGILMNVFLFLIKLSFGIVANSVAMIADAFNNITDAGSSVVSFIGFKLSIKHVDKKHPFGHGRMEYITGFIVDMLIILVGFELFKGSVEKIITPTLPDADWFTVAVLALSIVIKLWLFFFYRKIGKKINSSSFKSTSVDSITDCAATALVLVSVIVSKYFDLLIDGYVGIFVSILILIAGIRSAKETIDLLLGMPPTSEYIKEIVEFVKKYPEIVGVHDIMVHDYGVGRKIISFHAEIPSDLNINYAHEVVDKLERDMNDRFGAIVTVHFDPISVNDEQVDRMKTFAAECAKEVDPRFSIHDFRMTKGEKYTNLIFDLVIPVDYNGDDDHAAQLVADKIKEKEPDCFAVIKSEHPYF
ncbi:MAG: cation transporter [Clostridia bacterium]|nr:cation transporter [Clostridia bacterium]